jgi:hypothetical protein
VTEPISQLELAEKLYDFGSKNDLKVTGKKKGKRKKKKKINHRLFSFVRVCFWRWRTERIRRINWRVRKKENKKKKK